MATLDSTSTTAEITAAYLDNCGYEEDDSATMAAAFITACRAMLSRGIRRVDFKGQTLEFSTQSLLELIKAARAWLQTAGSTSGGVKHPDLRDFRD